MVAMMAFGCGVVKGTCPLQLLSSRTSRPPATLNNIATTALLASCIIAWLRLPFCRVCRTLPSCLTWAPRS